MSYAPKKIARRTLERLEKHGDNIYDGLTPAAPQSIIDTNRALERMELDSRMDRKYKDKIELSKRLMGVDTDYFGVNKDIANSLIDYIEQSGEEIMLELKNEMRTKRDEFQLMVKEIKNMKEEDYLSVIDYKRAVSHRIKIAREFEDRLNYFKSIIRTVENFESEYDEVPESKPWDFSFTNENASFYGASKLK